MITKKDIELLVDYFASLESIPETLTNTVAKLDEIDKINKAQDKLVELNGTGE